jgi:hypothetical protein
MAEREHSKALSELLDRLETQAAEGYARITFPGKAVGKDSDNLHVAVASGIVAIPFSEIEAVRPIEGRTPTEIMIDVANGDQITHLRRIPDAVRALPGDTRIPWGGGDFGPEGPGGPTVLGPPVTDFPHVNPEANASSSTGDCNGIDTTTAHGGEADSTDDYRQNCWHDTD